MKSVFFKILIYVILIVSYSIYFIDVIYDHRDESIYSFKSLCRYFAFIVILLSIITRFIYYLKKKNKS